MAVLAVRASLGPVGLAAIRLGSMTYSPLIVQPRAAQLVGQRHEPRWSPPELAGRSLAVCAGLALTGTAPAMLRTGTAPAAPAPAPARHGGWWAAKVVSRR